MLLIIICRHITPFTHGSAPHNRIVKGGLRSMAIGNLNIAGGGRSIPYWIDLYEF
nr:MAG TPA: hypothetical protein [Caudoviricetes sp.]